MNLLQGSVASDGNTFVVDAGPTLPLPKHSPELSRRALVLGIRPEHLQSAADPADATHVDLKVDYCERLGAENLAYGRWGTQSVVARLPHETLPASGQNFAITVRPRLFHFFDPGDGKRIEA